MSEETVEVEVITPSIDDLLDAIAGEQALDASKVFGNLMKSKMDDALEAEKVRVAGQIFNGEEEVELSDEEIEAELADEEQETEEAPEAEAEEVVADEEAPEVEAEVEDEPVAEVEVEEPVAEVGADEEHEEVEDPLGLYSDEQAEADVEEILSDEEATEE
jgi:hypothetical protein